jgi:two-component system, sensor histidine kinase and response regulator
VIDPAIPTCPPGWFDGQPILVLIADDDASILRTVKTALQRAGFAVAVARDGAQALALATAQPPDLAMVDVRMPFVDGLEVIRQLKARAPNRPVMAVSGTGDLDSRCAAFDAGADDFVEKPFYLREVLMRIEAHARNHRAARELQRLGEHADHLRMYASEAAALLAHDLNNGLAVVKANLEYLADSMKSAAEFDDEAADAAAAAQRALARMITLVRNFVDISRMEDDVLRPTRSDAAIAEIVRSVAEIHQPRRTLSELELEIDVEATLRAHIDPVLLERILHNLMNNSMRYVNRNGRVRIAARLASGSAAADLIVTVANSGPTIPPDLRASLFDKYTTGRDRRAQSGMGLYFCRLASEAHGGAISLVDDPEFATCFEVRLPSTERAAAPASSALYRTEPRKNESLADVG